MADETITETPKETPKETPVETPKPPETVTPPPATTTSETPKSNDPDLLNAINALPEKLANMLLERNPKPEAEKVTETKQEGEGESPNGGNLTWEKKFARMWFG